MKIHFIGIGGIGISGLAQYMKFRGHEVSGSDIADSLITKKLRNLGIKVTVPHSSDAITDQDLVVHSAIIRPDNPEVLAAKAKKLKYSLVVKRFLLFLEIEKYTLLPERMAKAPQLQSLLLSCKVQLLSVQNQRHLAQMSDMMKLQTLCSLKRMRVMEVF